MRRRRYSGVAGAVRRQRRSAGGVACADERHRVAACRACVRGGGLERACSRARAVRDWRAGLRPWCGVAVAARHAERRVRGRCGQTGAARVHAAERVLRARVGSMAVRGECEGEPDRAWSAGRLGVARLLRSAREEEGRARPALEWPSGERERGRGARSTGAERAERRGVARSGRTIEEEGSECASAAKAECAGQGRHARPGARARGAVARAAGANCGRRSRDETVAREKRERARCGRRKRKVDIDEWIQESGIGCSGQRKDFQNLGFRF